MSGWGSEELETYPDGEKDLLGLGPYLCPECKAGLSQPVEGMDRWICLNACHLGASGAARFAEHMRRVVERGAD